MDSASYLSGSGLFTLKQWILVTSVQEVLEDVAICCTALAREMDDITWNKKAKAIFRAVETISKIRR